MELRLEEKDFNILYSGKTIDTDDARYRYITSFDPNSEDDYVEALIHDADQNFIQSVIVDREDYTYNEIEGKPEIKLNTGTILRKIGYDRGKYVIKYNFLRKKAGSYETILVDENSDRYVGEYHVMPDGTIMDGESHKDSTGKILQVKELKYFIQEISPSRNEIRIVPQKIKDDKYIGSFVNLQTRNNEYVFKNTVRLFPSEEQKPAVTGSKTLYISSDENIRPNMVGGVLSINDAFIERIIPPTPQPNEGNLFEEIDTVDEVGPDGGVIVAARFAIIDETTNFFVQGQKDFGVFYNTLTRNGAIKNMSLEDRPTFEDDFNYQTSNVIKNVTGAKTDGPNKILQYCAQFTHDSVDAENVAARLTLGSISSRPQNVAFEYEWTIFGYDRNKRDDNHYYDPITGRVGANGDIIIEGEPAGSLTAVGVDKKQITIQIYGSDLRVGVGLKISRPAAGLVSSVFLPHVIYNGEF